jgi:hypothetical protein
VRVEADRPDTTPHHARHLGVHPTSCREPAPSGPGWQPVLTVRARVDKRDQRRFIANGLHAIHTFMREHDHKPAGLPFYTTTRPTGGRAVDVEAGWPTHQPVTGSGRIHSGMLPTTLVSHLRQPANEGREATDLL